MATLDDLPEDALAQLQQASDQGGAAGNAAREALEAVASALEKVREEQKVEELRRIIAETAITLEGVYQKVKPHTSKEAVEAFLREALATQGGGTAAVPPAAVIKAAALTRRQIVDLKGPAEAASTIAGDLGPRIAGALDQSRTVNTVTKYKKAYPGSVVAAKLVGLRFEIDQRLAGVNDKTKG